MTVELSVSTRLNKQIEQAVEICNESANEAKKIGYMAKALVIATMPHRDTGRNEFVRKNGRYQLVMMSPSSIGLPSGSLPRLILAWIITEAVKTKKREIQLGKSLASFMKEMDLCATGGQWGSIKRIKEQMKRLFATSISLIEDEADVFLKQGLSPVESANIWWNPTTNVKSESSITLSESFFNMITANPVPIDLRALIHLKQSPMKIDIYIWLTYRYSSLKKKVAIKWPDLQMQFGSVYSDDDRGRRNFKSKFKACLEKVCLVYPSANYEIKTQVLILLPSETHVQKRGRFND